MRRTIGTTVGLAIAGLLALYDIAAAGVGGDAQRPTAVAAAGVVLGIVTIAGIFLAMRGARSGVALVIATRVLSALTAVPAFLGPTVPSPTVLAVAVTGAVITGLVVVLLAFGMRSGAGRTGDPPVVDVALDNRQ